MMKKWMVCLCAGILVFGLTACGGKKEEEPVSDGQAQENVQESTPGGTQGSTPDGMPDALPELSPSDVMDEPITLPGGPGDVAASGWSEEMTAVKEAVVQELGDNYWPSMAIPSDFLQMQYGLTSDMYDDFLAEIPMMSAHVDTLVIIKAKDGQVDAVAEALNKYRDNMVASTNQYPMNLGKIQASKVETIGNYVCYVLLGGDTTAAEEKGDEAVIAHCQDVNERVLEIISEKLAQ